MNRATVFALALTMTAGLNWAAPVVVAEDAPKVKEAGANTPAQEEVIKLYKEYQEIQTAANKARGELSKAYKDAKTEDEKAEIVKKYDELNALENPKIEKAREAFVAGFMKTELDGWDVTKNAELVESGLLSAASAKEETDPKAAVALYEKFLEKLPKARSAGFVSGRALPNALIATGDFAAAGTRVAALAKDAEEQAKPSLLITLGDIKAITGDIEGAQKTYAEAMALIPEKLEKNDARGSVKRYLEPRISLLGKPAPEIDSKNWVGSEAKSLSSLKGTVLLIDVWATW